MRIQRVSNATEIREVEKLASLIWKQHYTPIIGEKQVAFMLRKFQSKSAIKRQMKRGIEYYLFKVSTRYVGYLSIAFEEKNIFLSKIYVDSSYRNQGVATQGILYVKKLLRQKRLHTLYLTVNINNNLALKSYEKMGFEKQGRVVQKIGHGYIMDDYKMSMRSY